MQCQKEMFDDFKHHRCTAKAKFEVNGIHYCGRHNPNKKRSTASIKADIDRLNRYKETLKAKRALQFLENQVAVGCAFAISLMEEISNINKEKIHELERELNER